jgi:hypothetical protein
MLFLLFLTKEFSLRILYFSEVFIWVSVGKIMKGNNMDRICCVCRVLCLLLAIGSLSGCVQSGPVGKWQKSGEAARVFESKTILQDHTYYFRGSEARPDAIIAIDNRYTLQTKVWAKIDMTQKILDDWIFWFNVHPSIVCPYVGGDIITPGGDTAGIWYSDQLVSVVKTLEPGVIQVYPPYSRPGSACSEIDRFDER